MAILWFLLALSSYRPFALLLSKLQGFQFLPKLQGFGAENWGV